MSTIHSHTRYLEGRNPMSQDNDIVFHEEGHVYECYNHLLNKKVSSKDDGELIIAVESVTTILRMFFKEVDFSQFSFAVWNKPENRVRMQTDTTYKYFGCTSIADIEAIWAQGAILGTKMHAVFEDISNIMEYERDQNDTTVIGKYTTEYIKENHPKYVETKYFNMFVKRFGLSIAPDSNRSFFRTEFRMYDPILQLSGTIDGLVYDKEKDGYIIYDFKRSKRVRPEPKKIRTTNPDSFGMHLPSWKKVYKANINTYGLQMSLYRFMFENIYKKKIIGLTLVLVDNELIPRDDALRLVNIPVNKFDEQIRELVAHRSSFIYGQYNDKLPGPYLTALEGLMTATLPKTAKRDTPDTSDTSNDQAMKIQAK